MDLIIVYQFCLHVLSPGDYTMAIQPLEVNHQIIPIKYIWYITVFLR